MTAPIRGTPSLRSFLSLLSLGALFATSACSDTTGADDRASFQYGTLGQALSTPMAAGASTDMVVTTSALARSAQSSDPTVLSVGAVASGGSAGTYAFPITARKPGSVTFTVNDVSGQEIDHTIVVVAPVTTIALDSGVTSGVTVLAGQDSFTVHGTVQGSGGDTLVGDGSVQFGYLGVLVQDADVGLCLGDCGAFSATSPGDGQVVLTTSTATTTLAVHAVAASSVDSISFPTSNLDLAVNGFGGGKYTLRAGGAVVHGTGIKCVSSDESVALVFVDLFGPSLVGDTTGSVGVSGVAPGSATITCTMSAATAQTWTIAVNVH